MPPMGQPPRRAESSESARGMMPDWMHVEASGGVTASWGPAGLTIRDENRKPIWAKITGQASSTNRYAWTQIDDGDTTAFDTGLSSFFAASGTSGVSGMPAYEVNGRTDVDIGARVLLWPGGDGSHFVFAYGDTGGNGGGVTRLFTHLTEVANVGTAETDLYSDVVPAGTLGTNGDVLKAEYFGRTATASTTLRVRFLGTVLFTQVLTFGTWRADVTILRYDSDEVKAAAVFHYDDGVFTESRVQKASVSGGGIDLGTTGYDLEITGQSSASNHIYAEGGFVEWRGA